MACRTGEIIAQTGKLPAWVPFEAQGKPAVQKRIATNGYIVRTWGAAVLRPYMVWVAALTVRVGATRIVRLSID